MWHRQMRFLESACILRPTALCVFVRTPAMCTQLRGGQAVTLVICSSGRILSPKELVGVERMRDIIPVVHILRVPQSWLVTVQGACEDRSVALICRLRRHQSVVGSIGDPGENLCQLLSAGPNLRGWIAHSLFIELQEIFGLLCLFPFDRRVCGAGPLPIPLTRPPLSCHRIPLTMRALL